MRLSSKLLVVLTAVSLTRCLMVTPALVEPITEHTRLKDLSEWSLTTASLNVWGLWAISKYKEERMPVIGNILSKLNPDVTLIQEAWQKESRQAIFRQSKLSKELYFSPPRTVGSGLYFLSHEPAGRAAFREFTLGGKLSSVTSEGEAVSGKGIASTTYAVRGLPVTFHNLHTIARWGEGDLAEIPEDKYIVHRFMAVFDIFRHIVEQTESDAFVVSGDFNFRYKHPEYNIWLKMTGLDGLRLEEFDKKTCTSCPENLFNENRNNGQIDFIWVSPRLKITQHRREFDQEIKANDGTMIRLSDHYGWYAQIHAIQGSSLQNPEQVRQRSVEAITYVHSRLVKFLDEIKGTVEAKGVEDRICLQCQVEDSISATEKYLKVLTSKEQLSKDEKKLLGRLESYYNIFR
ncbi:MAG: endonuclease/exonuclease/phosphatase family protein [Oligoflexia bacterium]|nr:endonuclease/exonuclease/phosphatase family protein [Oligoflexia bacterium]